MVEAAAEPGCSEALSASAAAIFFFFFFFPSADVCPSRVRSGVRLGVLVTRSEPLPAAFKVSANHSASHAFQIVASGNGLIGLITAFIPFSTPALPLWGTAGISGSRLVLSGCSVPVKNIPVEWRSSWVEV